MHLFTHSFTPVHPPCLWEKTCEHIKTLADAGMQNSTQPVSRAQDRIQRPWIREEEKSNSMLC